MSKEIVAISNVHVYLDENGTAGVFKSTKDLAVVEYSGERVLTTEQLAQVCESSTAQIEQIFTNSEDEFTEGKHYFKTEGETLAKLRSANSGLQISPMTRTLYFWTKSGILRYCRMLDTEKAWAAFEELDKSYFNVKSKELSTHAKQINIAEVVLNVSKAAETIQQCFGVSKDISLETATAIAEKIFEIDLSSLKALCQLVKQKTGALTVRQIGEQISMSAYKVNKLLAELGLQFKKGSYWRATEKGRKYVQRYNGCQIIWLHTIKEFLMSKCF